MDRAGYLKLRSGDRHQFYLHFYNEMKNQFPQAPNHIEFAQQVENEYQIKYGVGFTVYNDKKFFINFVYSKPINGQMQLLLIY